MNVAGSQSDLDTLADRIASITGKICDEEGYVKDSDVQPFAKLDGFIGAGGQYIVFSGTLDFDRIPDFSHFWIPRRAHELMDRDGGRLGQALDYARRAAKEAQELGPEKVKREMTAFLRKNQYFSGGRCAVKVSYESLTAMPRAKREAFTIGMHHPNIVYTIAEGKTTGNRIYRVMELIKDPLPQSKISSTLTLDELVEATLKVAQVLDFIERKGAVHRDLKPENILIGRGHREVHPKVTDFGLMKLREFNEVFTFLTASSCVLLGTPEFIAPEQARNPSEADIRADLYCLGATAYSWWTGASPNPVREDVSPQERVHLKFLNAISREKKPLAPLKLKAARDFFGTKARRFQTVLAGCLRTNPLERYQKPSDVVEDLERVQAGKAPVHLKDPLDKVLREAYHGGYGGGALRKAFAAVLLLLVVVAAAYVFLNEVPDVRGYRPPAVRDAVPWYRP
jgi:serine/threonine protein kinase